MIWPVVRLPQVRVIYLYLYQIPQVLTTGPVSAHRHYLRLSDDGHLAPGITFKYRN